LHATRHHPDAAIGSRSRRIHSRISQKRNSWGRQLADRIGQSQWWVARSESGSRRIDVAEFIQFWIGCRMAPPAALVELMKLRR